MDDVTSNVVVRIPVDTDISTITTTFITIIRSHVRLIPAMYAVAVSLTLREDGGPLRLRAKAEGSNR
jgi:hypothetical protein